MLLLYTTTLSVNTTYSSISTRNIFVTGHFSRGTLTLKRKPASGTCGPSYMGSIRTCSGGFDSVSIRAMDCGSRVSVVPASRLNMAIAFFSCNFFAGSDTNGVRRTPFTRITSTIGAARTVG